MMHSLVELSHLDGAVAVYSAPSVPRPFPEAVSLESVAAAVGTAPTGADMTFTVRLEPAGTVITTGTIAATEKVATFSAFDAGVAVATGSWLEVRVTQVGSTVAGSELVVNGKLGFEH